MIKLDQSLMEISLDDMVYFKFKDGIIEVGETLEHYWEGELSAADAKKLSIWLGAAVDAMEAVKHE